MSDPSNNAESIFGQAIEIESAEERGAFLQQACGNDTQLRADVEKLVVDHFRAGSFLNDPAMPGNTATVDPSMTEAIGTQIGPYKLLQVIGEGGMGVVYMAEQRVPVKRRVALKVIKPGMDSKQVLARFEAERQALAMMDHPNIAKVLDVGSTDNGRPYFVMELVKGLAITDYCDQQRLAPRDRLDLFKTVCDAIQHAHQKGLIHRDIKPSNILIASYDGKPVAKVIDFGVAKAIGQQLTERTLFTGFGSIVGTLEYMSPEQAEFNAMDVDTRSDIYSLGVLLYELLTGSTPLGKNRLENAAINELLRAIREEEAQRPSVRVSESRQTLQAISMARRLEPTRLTKLIQGDLDWLVMKAIDKDRSRRYATASGFADDVQRYLNNEPINARPPSTLYRLRKTVAKHRGFVLAAAVAVLTLATATPLSIALAIHARQAETLAVEQREIAIATEGRLRETLQQWLIEITGVALDKAFSGDFQEAKEAIERAELAEAPEELTESLWGITLFFDGQTEEAITRLERAVAESPDSVIANSALFWAYRHTGQKYKMTVTKAKLAQSSSKPKGRYEQFFRCLTRAIGGSEKSVTEVLHEMDLLLEQNSDLGAAYAMRATAYCHLGIEAEEPKLDHFERAIADFEEAYRRLPDSPFVITVGLMVLTSGIELADYRNIDAAQWQSRGAELASRMDAWPHYLQGRSWRVAYYRAVGQVEEADQEIEALLQHNIGGPFQHLGAPDAEKEFSATVEEADARICLALELAQKSPASGERAMEIFNEIQEDSDMPDGFKVIALDIPLLLGRGDVVTDAAQQLLDSALAEEEWSWWRKIPEYYTGELTEQELLDLCEPFCSDLSTAHYAIAMKKLSGGDAARAREHFQRTVELGRIGWFNYHSTRYYKEQLERDPTWLNWINVEDSRTP